MKHRIIFFLCVTFVFIQGIKAAIIEPDTVQNKKSGLSYGLEADVCNKYIWRGIDYNHGLVLQPNAWLTFRNFTFGVWNNTTLHDIHNEIKRNEIDLTLSYKHSFRQLEIEYAFTYYMYLYQDDSPPTGEVFLNLAYPIGDFKLITNFSFDVVKYYGAFFAEHGVEYELPITKSLSFTPSLCLGWASGKFNETYIGNSEATLNFLSGCLSFTYYPLEYLYVKPHFLYHKTIDKRLYDYIGKDSNFFGLLIGFEL